MKYHLDLFSHVEGSMPVTRIDPDTIQHKCAATGPFEAHDAAGQRRLSRSRFADHANCRSPSHGKRRIGQSIERLPHARGAISLRERAARSCRHTAPVGVRSACRILKTSMTPAGWDVIPRCGGSSAARLSSAKRPRPTRWGRSRPPMASPETSRMLAFAPFHGFIWGMSVYVSPASFWRS
jgi:hypothetical protein